MSVSTITHTFLNLQHPLSKAAPVVRFFVTPLGRIGDLNDGTRLYSEFLNTEWDGEVRIDDLRFITSSTMAEQVEFLTVRVGPSAYTKTKGYRVIEEDDSIDTLGQIAAESVLKVFKPACSSLLFF